MQHRQITVRLLFPSNQQSSAAVDPAMRSLHHPTACGLFGIAPCFFAPRADMGNEPPQPQGASQPVGVIPLVQTQMLRTFLRRRGADNRDTLKRIRHHLDVRRVCAVNRQPYGNAVGIGEQAPFDAFLATVGGIGAAFFPPRGAPWSSPRPWKATSSRCLSPRHTRGDLPPRADEKRPLSPMLENADGRWSRNKSRWRPRRSTGILHAVRRERHQRQHGCPRVSFRRPGDEYSPVAATRRRFSLLFLFCLPF